MHCERRACCIAGGRCKCRACLCGPRGHYQCKIFSTRRSSIMQDYLIYFGQIMYESTYNCSSNVYIYIYICGGKAKKQSSWCFFWKLKMCRFMCGPSHCIRLGLFSSLCVFVFFDLAPMTFSDCVLVSVSSSLVSDTSPHFQSWPYKEIIIIYVYNCYFLYIFKKSSLIKLCLRQKAAMCVTKRDV